MTLEEQLLPHKDLAPLYDQAVWLYVYRTFQRDEADRAAERISLRFGVTSWPQLLLVDPLKLTVTTRAGRTLPTFKEAFTRARLAEAIPAKAQAGSRKALADAERIAIELEAATDAVFAGKLLQNKAVADIVVRTRALQLVGEHDPTWIARRAKTLLDTPSDPFRYLVCKVLADHPDPAANDALEALVREPTNSLNPNVLRIRAVQALAASGDIGSVEVIAPHATSGAFFNGLTGIAVDALAAIGKRREKARDLVRETLLRAYPALPEDGDARKLRACTALAKRVHKALDSKLPFPETYDAKSRDVLMKEPK